MTLHEITLSDGERAQLEDLATNRSENVHLLEDVDVLRRYHDQLPDVRRQGRLNILTTLYELVVNGRHSFRFFPTTLYEPTRPQVGVQATSTLQPGRTVSGLVALTASLPPEVVADLERREKDFSLMERGSSEHVSLLLGPLRFVNHDCHPNCRMVWKGDGTVGATAIGTIQPGDEITFFYGDSYFGPDNAECRCRTCQTGKTQQ